MVKPHLHVAAQGIYVCTVLCDTAYVNEERRSGNFRATVPGQINTNVGSPSVQHGGGAQGLPRVQQDRCRAVPVDDETYGGATWAVDPDCGGA